MSKKKMDRRKFLKMSGAASAAVGSVGLGMFGYEAGKSPDSYTGWKNREGGFQSFDREKWAVDTPTYEKVGETRRIDGRSEMIFGRMRYFFRNYDPEKGMESLPDFLQDYYKKHPKDLETDAYLRKEIFPKMREAKKKYKDQFRLIEAYSHAMGAGSPRRIDQPAEKSEFPKGEH